jgi:hypothetical protein
MELIKSFKIPCYEWRKGNNFLLLGAGYSVLGTGLLVQDTRYWSVVLPSAQYPVTSF